MHGHMGTAGDCEEQLGGAMPKKSFMRKKAFREACRAQVRDGFINHADGTWKRAQSDKRMDQDMRNGYRVR